MRLLVFGNARDKRIRSLLMDTLNKLNPKTIIYGDEDDLAKVISIYASNSHVNIEIYKPAWGRYSLHAMSIRNEKMIEKGKPDFIIICNKTIFSDLDYIYASGIPVGFLKT